MFKMHNQAWEVISKQDPNAGNSHVAEYQSWKVPKYKKYDFGHLMSTIALFHIVYLA